MNEITIATAQFPVSANIERNYTFIRKLAIKAKKAGADVVHFPEVSLGGYAGVDFNSWDRYNWESLRNTEEEILFLSGTLNMGIIYGSNHKTTEGTISNSLLFASGEGKQTAGYNKRFCTERDLRYYTSGRQRTVFAIRGFTCGMLICYDLRFPELYREYKKQDVQIMFQSFYNARAHSRNIHTDIMRPTLQARAATNYFYISASNASGYYQSWPSVFITPDGRIKSSCSRHRSGLIVNTVSGRDTYYDASAPYREKAIAGRLYSA